MQTADGVVLRTAWWPGEAQPGRGTVLLLQGRAEFIEKYYEVVGELRARGFAVATFDWRGQGHSGRALRRPEHGHVASFAEFGLDLEAVAAAVLPSCPGPVLALAHSMGGCVALGRAAAGTLPADRLVAIAPMVGLSIVRRTALVRAVARLLRLAGAGPRPVPGGSPRSMLLLPFAGNRLTRDPARYERTRRAAQALGAAAVGAPTVGWLDAAFDAMRALTGRGGALSVPTLIVAAGDDPVCSTRDAVRFAQALGPDRLVVIPDARHEILMERDEVRAAFWRAFDAFAAPGPVSAGGQEMQDGVVQPPIA